MRHWKRIRRARLAVLGVGVATLVRAVILRVSGPPLLAVNVGVLAAVLLGCARWARRRPLSGLIGALSILAPVVAANTALTIDSYRPPDELEQGLFIDPAYGQVLGALGHALPVSSEESWLLALVISLTVLALIWRALPAAAAVEQGAGEGVEETRSPDSWSKLRPAFGCFLTFGAVSISAQLSDVGHHLLFPDAVGIACCAVYGWRDRREIANLFRISRSAPVHGLWAVGALIGAGLFMTAYVHLFEAMGAEVHSVTAEYRAAGWSTLQVLASLAVATPLMEEVLFRGFIQRRLALVLSSREALILQAMMFAPLHFSTSSLISHFLFGVLLGHLRNVTGHLYCGLAVHAAWNAWVVLT